MPLRALAITTRHHPVAIGAYCGATALALLQLTNAASAASMISEVGEHVTFAWQSLLFVGGLITLVSIFLPNKWLTRSLAFEALGTFIVGLELIIYAGVMAFGLDDPPLTTIVALGSTGLGCWGRTWTAYRDQKRLLKAVRLHEAISSDCVRRSET